MTNIKDRIIDIYRVIYSVYNVINQYDDYAKFEMIMYYTTQIVMKNISGVTEYDVWQSVLDYSIKLEIQNIYSRNGLIVK